MMRRATAISCLVFMALMPAANGSAQDKAGLEYVAIPAGSFEMGCVPGDSECSGDENPRHKVRIGRGFRMAKTETTVAAYKRFVSAAGKSMPDEPEFNRGWTKQDHPIVNVNWGDAKAFCEWSGGRLPSDAEWEYAARGGAVGTAYPWGNKISHDEANYAGTGGRDRWVSTSPAASFPANGFGLHDMSGNVWEWVEDALPDLYEGAPVRHILRGGSWIDEPSGLRVSKRDWYAPEVRIDNGFRCVRNGN